jgi:hypothetical protein
MRMLLLAGAVAGAVLAVVVLVGLGLVDEDEPSWSERATAVCERGLGDNREAASAGTAIAGAERRALQVYAETTRIEGGVLQELEALPRPAEDELAIERTLTILGKSHQADVAAVAKLRRRFDRVLFERRVNDTIPILADVRSRFARLGAQGCVRFYDPNSYRTR